jgi:hypothetical protein
MRQAMRLPYNLQERRAGVIDGLVGRPRRLPIYRNAAGGAPLLKMAFAAANARPFLPFPIRVIRAIRG